MTARTRTKAPSRAVKAGAVVTAIGAVIEAGAALGGLPLPPGTGLALATVFAPLATYFARGGRKGEAD